MIVDFPPGLLLIIGALLVPFIKGQMRQVYMLALPILGIFQLMFLDAGTFGTISLFGYELTHVRVDKLSLVFGYIFYVATALGVIFAWQNDDLVEQASALVYVGAAIGAVFAGDLITLFVYWELTAIASVFIIWAGRTDRAYSAAMRYLLIQIVSGVLLAAGAVVRAAETGSVTFNEIGLDSPGGLLILLAFGIKCAFPLLHNWLPDAYPEATPTGTVFLSAITTKLAIYVLARGYAGTEELIWIGAAMAALPIIYAVMENDLRRVLAYSLNSQLGYMVVGIGVGTTLALNGAVAHAVVHILYKGLLFMSIGAVLYRVGSAKVSDLGGLRRTMPITMVFCLIGAGSISAFPIFSAFASKSLILSGAAKEGHELAFIILLFASACALLYAGIKIPFFTFFGKDSEKRPQEAPFNMLLAMFGAAALSMWIGIHPESLFAFLPFPVSYEPYTLTHVVTMFQMLAMSALVFAVLYAMGLFPKHFRSTLLDFDFSYRWLAPRVVGWVMNRGAGAWESMRADMQRMVQNVIDFAFRYHGPSGILARTANIGPSAGIIVTVLFVILVAVLA